MGIPICTSTDANTQLFENAYSVEVSRYNSPGDMMSNVMNLLILHFYAWIKRVKEIKQ